MIPFVRAEENDVMTIMRPKPRRKSVRAAAAVLAVAAVVVGVLLVEPGSCPAATAAGTVPVRLKALQIGSGLPIAPNADILARRSTASATGTPVTLDAGMRFSMVGVVCDAPGAAARVVVLLRTSSDGMRWSRWYEAPLERNGQAGRTGQAFTDALWTGAARYVQVGARVETARRPTELSNARVVAIGSFENAEAPAAAGSPGPASAAAEAATLTSRAASLPAPRIVTRAAWGADESLRAAAPAYAAVKMAFVHHTAGGNDYAQANAPAIVRGIYAYHTKALGWNDIGYNFLIDRFGTIYEGRYGGVDKGVVGAQVLGFNTGSTGVSVIGTYASEAPPAAAVASLENLLAWKLSLGGLDSAGTAKMTCGATEKFKAGTAVTLPVIAGHRDANYTECPGDALYAILPTIRTAVGKRINPTKWVVTLELSTASTTVGSSVTCSGAVTTAMGAAGSGTVTVQRRPVAGGAWTDWRTAPLDVDGTYSLAVEMSNHNAWECRTKMPGVTGVLTGFSPLQVLTVRPVDVAAWRVTLRLSAASVPAGSIVRCSGSVKTASGSPGSGRVTIQRRAASGGAWLDWRTATLDPRGGYAVTARMVNRNSWQLRARMAGTPAALAGYSAGGELTVY